MGLTRFERALRRRRWRMSDAEAVVSAWEASSSSMTGFAAEHGLKFERIRRWRKRLRGRAGHEARGDHSAVIPLAPVVIRALTEPAEQPRRELLTAAHGRLDVSVGPGVIRVPSDFDDDHLRRVVAVLSSAC